jgi:NitT/TauT family transport system ATP-binding protein
MLEIKKLSVSYDGQAVLNKLNFQVADGEICTIVGPSGCGKSTLLKAVAGLLKGFSGDILFDGQAISAKQHTIGYIPQNYGLLPWKTVEQNITVALKIKGLPLEKNGQSVAHSALERVGMTAHKKKFPSALSGGQKQRVAIARAFVLEPDVLLMDEPFSALDGVTKEEMQQFFLDIWQGREGATLFITHDIEEAVFLGKKVVVMLPGQEIQILKSPGVMRESEEFVNMCSHIRKLMKGARTYVK